MNTMANRTTSVPLLHLLPQAYFLNIHLDEHHNGFLLATIAINGLICTISACANLIIIATIGMTTSLRTSSNILVLGLAVSDCCSSLISQPSYCLYLFAEYKRDASLFLAVRNVFVPSTTLLALVTLLTLTAITGDRFLAIRLHVRYQEIVKPRRCGILLMSIWGFSLLTCVGRVLFEILEIQVVLNVFAFAVGSGILCLNGFFFVNIFKSVRRHSTQIHAQQPSTNQAPVHLLRFKKTVKTVVYVIGAFVVSYVPTIVGLAVYLSMNRYTQALRTMVIVNESLLMMNGIINPMIYFWRISELREAVKRNLRRHLSWLNVCC